MGLTAPPDDLALRALALPALLARLWLALGRRLTARLMFRGRRRRRMRGPRLLLAATALSAGPWLALRVSRGYGALLWPRNWGLPLSWGHGTLPLSGNRAFLLSRGHATLALARNRALRWRHRPLRRWRSALGRHFRRT